VDVPACARKIASDDSGQCGHVGRTGLGFPPIMYDVMPGRRGGGEEGGGGGQGADWLQAGPLHWLRGMTGGSHCKSHVLGIHIWTSSLRNIGPSEV
jgi:hypothetical protein